MSAAEDKLKQIQELLAGANVSTEAASDFSGKQYGFNPERGARVQEILGASEGLSYAESKRGTMIESTTEVADGELTSDKITAKLAGTDIVTAQVENDELVGGVHQDLQQELAREVEASGLSEEQQSAFYEEVQQRRQRASARAVEDSGRDQFVERTEERDTQDRAVSEPPEQPDAAPYVEQEEIRESDPVRTARDGGEPGSAPERVDGVEPSGEPGEGASVDIQADQVTVEAVEATETGDQEASRLAGDSAAAPEEPQSPATPGEESGSQRGSERASEGSGGLAGVVSLFDTARDSMISALPIGDDAKETLNKGFGAMDSVRDKFISGVSDTATKIGESLGILDPEEPAGAAALAEKGTAIGESLGILDPEEPAGAAALAEKGTAKKQGQGLMDIARDSDALVTDPDRMLDANVGLIGGARDNGDSGGDSPGTEIVERLEEIRDDVNTLVESTDPTSGVDTEQELREGVTAAGMGDGLLGQASKGGGIFSGLIDTARDAVSGLFGDDTERDKLATAAPSSSGAESTDILEKLDEINQSVQSLSPEEQGSTAEKLAKESEEADTRTSQAAEMSEGNVQLSDGSRASHRRPVGDVPIGHAAAASDPAAPATKDADGTTRTVDPLQEKSVVEGNIAPRKLTGQAQLYVNDLPVGIMDLALEETD